MELEGAAVIATIQRPPYKSCPPALANFEILPESEKASYGAVLARPHALPPVSHLVRLLNAIVFDNGFVMTSDGRLIDETLPAGRQLPSSFQPTRRISEPLALLRKAGDSSYGHWMVELLPRVFDFRERLAEKKLKYGVPYNPIEMRDVRKTSLNWLDLKESDVVWLTADPVIVDELFFLTKTSVHSHLHDAAGVRRVSEVARSLVPPGEYPKRIFVRRPPAGRRRLIGEDEILAVAREHNFEEVFPESLSSDAQVQMFSQAAAIAGVTGSALTNMLWAPAECQVCVLSPNLGSEFFFWDIANIRGQEFSYIFGSAVGEPAGVHSDFSISAPEFSKWVSALK
jgi:capsular polysaccharide biosynthesis protein